MKLSPQRARDIANKLLDLIASGTTDMADEVITIDPSIYVDPEVAARERERIFRTQPLVAVHSSEVARPGDWVVVRLNEVEAIITRRMDGAVAAFLNVCRHRGARLLTGRTGQGRVFTCGYHGWTYANTGEPRGVSYAKTFGELPCDDIRLIELPAEERHGFVWVLENPEGTLALSNHLGPEMGQLLEELELGTYHYYKGEVLEISQNWKIMAHGLLDGYHVRFLHGETIAPYFHFNIMGANVLTSHSFHATPRKRIEELEHGFKDDVDLRRYAIFSAYLSPNTQLVLHPHHVEFWTMYQDPWNPGRCRAHLRFLTPRAIETDEDRTTVDKNYRILTNAVIHEDVPAGNGCQANAAAPYGPRELFLGRNEILNQLFQRNYDRLMAG